MKTSNIKLLTTDKMFTTNMSVLRDARRSLVTISMALSIPVLSFPEPAVSVVCYIVDMINYLNTKNKNLSSESLALMAAFVVEQKIDKVSICEALSGFAYILSYHGCYVTSLNGSLKQYRDAAEELVRYDYNDYVWSEQSKIFANSGITVHIVDKVDIAVRVLSLNGDAQDSTAIETVFKDNRRNILSCFGMETEELSTLYYDLSTTWRTLVNRYTALDNDVLCGHIEYLLLLWVFSPLSQCEGTPLGNVPVNFLRRVEQVAYYFAAIGYSIKSNDVKFSDEVVRSLSLVISENNDIKLSQLNTEYLSGIEFVQYKRASELPEDLVEHLDKFTSTQEKVEEICKLQKLSPVSILTEDPQKALVNAWRIGQGIEC